MTGNRNNFSDYRCDFQLFLVIWSVLLQAPPIDDIQAQPSKPLAKINFDTGAPKRKGCKLIINSPSIICCIKLVLCLMPYYILYLRQIHAGWNRWDYQATQSIQSPSHCQRTCNSRGRLSDLVMRATWTISTYMCIRTCTTCMSVYCTFIWIFSVSCVTKFLLGNWLSPYKIELSTGNVYIDSLR